MFSKLGSPNKKAEGAVAPSAKQIQKCKSYNPNSFKT